jgi:uncharacterized protein
VRPALRPAWAASAKAASLRVNAEGLHRQEANGHPTAPIRQAPGESSRAAQNPARGAVAGQPRRAGLGAADLGGIVVTVSFAPVPATAAWHHRGARSGFEVVYFAARGEGCRVEGWTAAIQEGVTWAVEYAIEVDAAWATRSATIRGRSAAGSASARLEADGYGRWLVDGQPAPRLDGCLDVDLEASAMTNALPVRRMGLPVAAAGDAPAAYVRAVGLAVERLEQTYARTTDQAGGQRYDYAAPAFGFTARLVYDESGLVLDYPGIAVRAG